MAEGRDIESDDQPVQLVGLAQQRAAEQLGRQGKAVAFVARGGQQHPSFVEVPTLVLGLPSSSRISPAAALGVAPGRPAAFAEHAGGDIHRYGAEPAG